MTLVGPYIPPIVLDPDYMRPSLVALMIREYEDILRDTEDEAGVRIVGHTLERLQELQSHLDGAP